MDIDRLWAAVIVPIGHRDVFGGMWDTDQLYLTRAEAVRDVEDHAIRMGLLPITWSQPEEKLLIGRTHAPGNEANAFAVLVRSARLPAGCKIQQPGRDSPAPPN